MAGSRKLELEARYFREAIRFAEDAAIVSVEPINGSRQIAMDAGWQPAWKPQDCLLSVKGDFAPDELQQNQSYRFYGMFSN